MYEPFFGLESSPFGLTPDPRFLFRSKTHHDILASLLYGVTTSKGVMLLIGDVGTGKTTLCRALLRELPELVESVLVLNLHLSDSELVGAILDDLGVARRGATTKGELMTVLSQHLLTIGGEGKTVVVVVDEAQQMSVEALEQIRILSTLEAPGHKLLQIVLAGQPELDEKLGRPDLRQLNQRIGVRCTLGPLSHAETARYIEHRLRAAGLGGGLPLTRAAITRVHRHSGGVPRVINLVCDRALAAAFSARSRNVDVSTVNAAIRSLGGDRRSRAVPRAAMAAAAVVGVLAVGVAVGAQFRTRVASPRTTESAPPAGSSPARSPSAPAANATAPAVTSAPVGAGSSPVPVMVAAAPLPAAAGASSPPRAATVSAAGVATPSPSPAPAGPPITDPRRRVLAELVGLWVGQTPSSTIVARWPSTGDGSPDIAGVAQLHQLGVTRLPRPTAAELRAIGLPVLLEGDGTHGLTVAMLRSIDGDTATLVDGTGAQSKRPFTELGAVLAGADAWIFWRNLDQLPVDPAQQMTPAVVMAVGLRLYKLGHLAMPIPHAFDARLAEGVRSFQRSIGLPQDGIMGPRTTLALSRVVAGTLAPNIGTTQK